VFSRAFLCRPKGTASSCPSFCEIVDPQTGNGKHKHLHIRAAVINAFIKPKKGQKVKYMYGQKVNTVYNLGIV